MGRQAASRNAHQINDNVRSFEAEETFTAHRHRGDPPEPKPRRITDGTEQYSRTPRTKNEEIAGGYTVHRRLARGAAEEIGKITDIIPPEEKSKKR